MKKWQPLQPAMWLSLITTSNVKKDFLDVYEGVTVQLKSSLCHDKSCDMSPTCVGKLPKRDRSPQGRGYISYR